MAQTLAEDLLLLALRDEEGTVPGGAQTALKFGLAGAIVAELTLQGRLRLNEKQKVELVDDSPTGDDLFDETIAAIGKHARGRNMKDWVLRFGNGGLKNLQKRLTQRLVDKGIVREEDGRVLWLFPTHHYPEVNPSPEQAVRDRLRGVVIQGDPADERTLLLLSLVRACNLTNEIFTKEERGEAKRRIGELAKGVAAGAAVAGAVAAVQAAVMAAVIASTAATTASTSS